MKHYLQLAKTYILNHKKQFTLAAYIVGAVLVIVLAIVMIASNLSKPIKIMYEPSVACSLFTKDEAVALLGVNATLGTTGDSTLSGNLSTSSCAYTDGTPGEDNMIVAAVIIRSGINDTGVEQNKVEFVNGKPAATGVMDVPNVGDKAYFNETLGQLNVLSGRNWYIFSFGVGSAPEANTLEQTTKLAAKVLELAVETPSF